MNKIQLSGLALAAMILAGCTTVYEGKYDFNDGWREAEVMQVAGAAEIAKPQFSDCRDTATAQQLAAGRFAALSYQRMGRKRTHVALVSPGQTFRAGDLVYANVTSCDARLVPRS